MPAAVVECSDDQILRSTQLSRKESTASATGSAREKDAFPAFSIAAKSTAAASSEGREDYPPPPPPRRISTSGSMRPTSKSACTQLSAAACGTGQMRQRDASRLAGDDGRVR